MPAPQSTHGVQLRLGDGVISPTFATVVNMETISFDGGNLSFEDVFTHDNATGMAERVFAALAAAGSFSATVALAMGDGTHDASSGLISICVSREQRAMEIVLPDTESTTLEFEAVITNWRFPDMPANAGVLRLQIDVALAGAVAFS